jgi:hypothetical protein
LVSGAAKPSRTYLSSLKSASDFSLYRKRLKTPFAAESTTACAKIGFPVFSPLCLSGERGARNVGGLEGGLEPPDEVRE